MVLNPSIIQIPFSGLQTKVDPKSAPIGSFEQLNNVSMERFPELTKVEGVSPIATNSVVSNINATYSYINETGVITNAGLFAYSPVRNAFLPKGSTASPIVVPTTVISNSYDQNNCDSSVTTSGLQGTVWEDSRGGIRCAIQDTQSDTFIRADFLLSSSGIKPKVVAADETITFFWIDTIPGGPLVGRQYECNTNSFDTQQTIQTSISSTYCFDATLCSNNILLTAVTTTVSPSTVQAIYWNIQTGMVAVFGSGLPIKSALSITNLTPSTPTLSLIAAADSSYFVVTWQNSSKQVYTKTFTNVFTALTTEFQVASATTDAGWAISSCIDLSNNTYIFYSTYNTTHNSFYAQVSGNITTPVLEYNSPFILQMAIASKAWYYTDNAYVVLAYSSSSGLQNTYFGVRDDGACWARIFTQVGGGAFSKSNCVTSVSIRPDKDNTYIFTLLKVTKIISNGPDLFLTTSVFSEQVYFTPSNIDNNPLSNLLTIAGGFLKNYDGSRTVYELGFHLYPETPTNTLTTGSIPDGVYSWIVCWEWPDNQGNLSRSTPSNPLTLTLSGGPQGVVVVVPCLPITNKQTRFEDLRTNVIMAVYRTLKGGTTYYRVNQLSNTWVFNDPTAATVSFTDTFTDTDIASNSLLYNTGGVLDNIVIPSMNVMCVSKNRVLGSSTDVDPNQVFYSKEKQGGIAIEFSNELSFIVDSLGGPITALASMDDKIILFKETLIYYVSGVLPDNLGNGPAPYPLLVTTICGCNYPQSIVLTAEGLMFQSPKGIYLLDRQLNVSYNGQAIDRYTNNITPPLKITSAVNLTNKNQVIFTNENNQAFIYDTFFQQWYTRSFNFSPVSANVLSDSWYVCSTNQMFQQISGQYFDGSSIPIISTIKTNWINFANLDGFVRIYAIMVVGSNANLPGTLKAKIYYDFQTYFTEVVSIVPYNASAESSWGSDTSWGSGDSWGGDFDGTYNFMIRPGRQKCSAIKVEIYDEFPDGEISQSFKFTGMSIAVGVKPTWNKSLSYLRRLT